MRVEVDYETQITEERTCEPYGFGTRQHIISWLWKFREKIETFFILFFKIFENQNFDIFRELCQIIFYIFSKDLSKFLEMLFDFFFRSENILARRAFSTRPNITFFLPFFLHSSLPLAIITSQKPSITLPFHIHNRSKSSTYDSLDIEATLPRTHNMERNLSLLKNSQM